MTSWTNELDRHVLEADPKKIKPLGNKIIVKRTIADDKKGSLFMPENAKARRPTFEGVVVAVGGEPGPDEIDVMISDYVYFSYAVNGQDSAFLTWKGESYAIIPYEAVQMIHAGK